MRKCFKTRFKKKKKSYVFWIINLNEYIKSKSQKFVLFQNKICGQTTHTMCLENLERFNFANVMFI